MKKRIIYLLLCFAVGLVILLQMLDIKRKNTTLKSFDFSEYQYYVENFPSKGNIGSTSDFKELVNKVETFWIKMYGESVKSQKPYKIYYDSNNDVLLLQGTLQTNTMGGVANMLIKKSTGEILAVWHDK